MPNKNFSRNLGTVEEAPTPRGHRNDLVIPDEEVSTDALLSGAQVPYEEDDDEENAGLMQAGVSSIPAASRLQNAAQNMGVFGTLEENPDDDDETGDASGHMGRIGVSGEAGMSQSLTMPDASGEVSYSGDGLPDFETEEPTQEIKPEVTEAEVSSMSESSDEEPEPKKRFSPCGFELDEEGLPIVPPEPTKKPGRASQEYIEKHESWKRAKEERERMIEERERSERLNAGLNIERKGVQAMDGKQTLEGTQVAQAILNFVCNSTIQNLKETYESEIYTKKYMDELFQGYLDGNVRSNNPLFKRLITECLEKAEPDPYLKDNTKLVLQYIHEH